MAYNIQMNYYDGSSYQELNPRTLLANVSDWSNSIYNKTEVDSIKNTLQGNIDSVKKFNFETSFDVNLATASDSISGNVRFTDYIRNYSKIIIDFSETDIGRAYASFFGGEEHEIITKELFVYECMISDTTNYIYYSYGDSIGTSYFYWFVNCPVGKQMPYKIRGGMLKGTIKVYAS